MLQGFKWSKTFENKNALFASRGGSRKTYGKTAGNSTNALIANIKRPDFPALWQEYTNGKQPLKQLAVRYGCSARTIRRRPDKVPPQHAQAATEGLNQTTAILSGFAFKRFGELSMAKATNLPEGYFGNFKRKLVCHQELKIEHKVKSIKDYFAKIP